MNNGDVPTPPGGVRDPNAIEDAFDVETLVTEESQRRARRRSRRGLRIPSDPVPRRDTDQTVAPSPDPSITEDATSVIDLPDGGFGELDTPPPGSDIVLVDGGETTVTVPPGPATTPAPPSVSSRPPPPVPATAIASVHRGPTAPPIPAPPAVPKLQVEPVSAPPPQSAPMSSAPPTEGAGGSSGAMRVVRRRIKMVVGNDDPAPRASAAPAPEEPAALPAEAVVRASPSVPPPPAVVAEAPPVSALPPPPAPQIEAHLGDDFEVPPVLEDEYPTPPPPSAPQPDLYRPPPATARDGRGDGRGDDDGPAIDTEPTSLIPEVDHAPAARAPAAHDEVHAVEDDSVEISLEEGGDDHGRKGDPSLALLDALAELPPDAPVVDDAPLRPITSVPPPPPPEARKAAAARAAAVTVPDKKRRRFWWEELFNEDYFRTMARLAPPQVQREGDWIEQALGVEGGAAILDVACGPGRQAIELARRGYEVVALDLSLAMLARGAETAQELGVKLNFLHADMTAMDFTESFDAAYCVGTSYGYFDDARNAEVARRMHRALKPHGTLLLEVLNRDHVIQRQPAMAWFEGDGCVCMEETAFNYITSRLNVKRTMIFEDGRQREIEYSIRLYSLHEIGQVLHEAGFRILEVSGHPHTPGAFFGPSSRELIILAQKRGPEVVEIPPSDGRSEPPRS